MTNVKNKLGIQSYCLRHFNESAWGIENLKACGASTPAAAELIL